MDLLTSAQVTEPAHQGLSIDLRTVEFTLFTGSGCEYVRFPVQSSLAEVWSILIKVKATGTIIMGDIRLLVN